MIALLFYPGSMHARLLLGSLVLLTACAALAATAVAQEATDAIRLNQIGFYPSAPKVGVAVDAAAGPFYVVNAAGTDTVFTGALSAARTWSASGETVRRADFSALQASGAYRLVVPGVGASHAFDIAPAVHRPLAAASLKGYYFQRTALPMEEAYAGVWDRPAGHPDDAVRVHPSAATDERPAGTILASPRGWYDAGDFNKYIVNSGISTYTLLALHEHYPAFTAALETAIPESGDAVPDVLDEALWNLRWMLTMQDPHDGGVYHKLTHANFQGILMPHRVTSPRYVVQKSTAATLGFAAVMAQAARVIAGYPDAFPGLADSMRTAALDAWQWARHNPGVLYDQSALNAAYSPDVVTGEYGDGSVDDEFAWAAAELFVTTGADSFLTVASPVSASPDVPWWGGVRALGWYTLLHHREQAAAAVDTSALKRRYLAFADDLADARGTSPYGIVMGRAPWDFVWGSNAVAANQGVALLQAFRLDRDSTYLWAALSNLDYLLGRNATGYSFVTDHGDVSPTDPHHRVSEADAVAAPVPGLLAGGPNPGQQDGCSYPSDLPARSYVDDWCSYASNEIAINWNAPLAYLAGALEATLAASGPTSRHESDVRSGAASVLLPPYPNPAAAETMLTFDLAEAALVRLEAFDLLGRRVAAWPARRYARGHHRLAWSLAGLPASLYIVRLTAGQQTTTQRLLKLGPS